MPNGHRLVVLHQPDVREEYCPPTVAILKWMYPNRAMMKLGSGRNHKFAGFAVPFLGFDGNNAEFSSDNVRTHADVLLSSPKFSRPTPNRSQHLPMQIQKPTERKWRELVAWFAQQVLLGHSQDRLELSFIELATRFDGLDFQTRPIKGCVIIFAG